MLREIDLLIRARYPLIYVVSSEEQRIINSIAKISKNQVFVWSCVSGIRSFDKLNEVSDATKDPLSVLRFINNTSEAGVFILCDFHTFLTEQNYDVVRFLKELNSKFKKVIKNIIILSPILNIPKELEKDINIVDFPLPNESEIATVYDNIADTFKNNPKVEINGSKEYIVKALAGLSIIEIENVLHKSIVKDRCFSLDTIIAEKSQIIRKTGILEYYHSSEAIGDVGGLDILKQWIVQRKSAFSNGAKKYGLPYPKGVLLLGVQGCGKSLSCKVISNIWKFPLLRLDMGSVFGGIVGESESNIRKAIQLAEAVSPSILWIDEVEKGFSGTQSSGHSDGGTTSRVFGTFLTWLQEKKKPVFVVATANDITALPPEFLRKGRFDDIFFIDLPNAEERSEIFKIHLSKRNWDVDNFDIDNLVKFSRDFSGAEIESAVISAMYESFDSGIELEDSYIISALEQTVPLSKTMQEVINGMRDWAKNRARPATSNTIIDIKRGIEL